MTVGELIELLQEQKNYHRVCGEIYDDDMDVESVEYDSHRGVIIKLRAD